MRRRVGRFLLIALLAVVVGFYPLLAPTAHRIDHGHFDLVQDGMTRTDVEAIFGVPAGRYDWAEPDSVMRFRVWMSLAGLAQAQEVPDRQIQHGIRFLKALEAVNEGGVSATWVSRHGAFTVHFDASGRVDPHCRRQRLGRLGQAPARSATGFSAGARHRLGGVAPLICTTRQFYLSRSNPCHHGKLWHSTKLVARNRTPIPSYRVLCRRPA